MRKSFLTATVLTGLVATSAFAIDTYKLVALGDLAGGDFRSRARAINDNGQIVGTSLTDTNLSAYIWENGVMSKINGFDSYLVNTARGINNAGLIAGMADTADDLDTAQAWILDGGGIPNYYFSGNPNVVYSHVAWLNNADQIAGVFKETGVGVRGYVRNADGSINVMGTLGGVSSNLRKINDLGIACGEAFDANGLQQAVTWDGNVISIVNGLAGYSEHRASTIKNSGLVIGTSTNSGFEQRSPWLYDGNTTTSLGLYGGFDSMGATDMLDDGSLILGKAFNAGQEDDETLGRGALWSSVTGWVDVNDYVDQTGDGYTILTLRKINANGWIIGDAINPDGNIEAILLIPSPSALALLGLAGLTLGKRRRRS